MSEQSLGHLHAAQEAYYAHTPGLKMVIPSGPRTARALLASAIRDPDPVIFFESKLIYRAFREAVPEDDDRLPIGTSRIVREGDDLTIITYGGMLRRTLEAAEQLAAQGVEAEVIDLLTLSPLDDETFTASARKTGRVVIVHEAHRSFGAGAEIVARLVEKAFFYLEAPIQRVTFAGDTALSDSTFDRVLVAVGRQPNTDGLGLQEAGVTVDVQGYVGVDAQQRTSNERLFAIGDVAGGMMLAHKAMYEGKIAAEVIAGQRAASDARAVPAVVYTDPQIAWCGLTEQAAKARNEPVSVARFPWKASGRALSMGASDGLTKLIIDRESQQILGVGIVGRDAEALIAEGVLAIEMGALAQDLALTMHPHPTLCETLGEAAAMLHGGSTHVLSRNT